MPHDAVFSINSSASFHWDSNGSTSGTGNAGSGNTWDATTANKWSDSTSNGFDNVSATGTVAVSSTDTVFKVILGTVDLTAKSFALSARPSARGWLDSGRGRNFLRGRCFVLIEIKEDRELAPDGIGLVFLEVDRIAVEEVEVER